MALSNTYVVPVPSRGSALAVVLYFIVTQKEIIAEEEKSKVGRRTEERSQTKEKTTEYALVTLLSGSVFL